MPACGCPSGMSEAWQIAALGHLLAGSVNAGGRLTLGKIDLWMKHRWLASCVEGASRI